MQAITNLGVALVASMTLGLPWTSYAAPTINTGTGGCTSSNKTAKRSFEFRDSGGGPVACNYATCTFGPFRYDLDNMDGICSYTQNFIGAAPLLAGWKVVTPNPTTFAGVTVGFSGVSFNASTQVLTFYVDVGLRNTVGGAADPNSWVVYSEIIGVSSSSIGGSYTKSCSAAGDTCTLNSTESNALQPYPNFNYVGDSITKITLDAHNNSNGFNLTDLRVKEFWSQPAGTRNLALSQTCKAGGATNISCTIESAVIASTSTELGLLQTTLSYTGLSAFYSANFSVPSTSPRHHFCSQRGFEVYFTGSTAQFMTLAAGATSTDCDTSTGGDWTGTTFGALDTSAGDLFDLKNYLNGTKLK